MDVAHPRFWRLPRACEHNLLHLLPRLTARLRVCSSAKAAECNGAGTSSSSDEDVDGIDPHYWAWQCSHGLVCAVQHDNLGSTTTVRACCRTLRCAQPQSVATCACCSGSQIATSMRRGCRRSWTPLLAPGSSTSCCGYTRIERLSAARSPPCRLMCAMDTTRWSSGSTSASAVASASLATTFIERSQTATWTWRWSCTATCKYIAWTWRTASLLLRLSVTSNC